METDARVCGRHRDARKSQRMAVPKQILLTSPIRNIRRTIRRIYVLVLVLKGCSFEKQKKTGQANSCSMACIGKGSLGIKRNKLKGNNRC